MSQKPDTNDPNKTLTPYLSMLGVFSLAVGTAIGWGSLVVTNSEYLLHAGPLGSTLGMVIGDVVVSAGLAVFDRDQDNTFHAVFERADKLMYVRKQELKSMGAITRE